MRLKVFSTIALSLFFCNQMMGPTLAEEKEFPSPTIDRDNLNHQPSNSALGPQEPSNDPFLQTPSNDSSRFQQPRKITIPESSALTTTFCSEVQFHHEQASKFPVTLALARPILDQNGQVVAPVNSMVRAKVDTTEEEVQVQPEAVVIGGRYIPIDTSAVSVPALIDSRGRTTSFVRSTFNSQRGVTFRIADNLSRWLISQQTTLDNDTSDLLGFGLSIATGLARGMNEPEPPDPEENEVMEIRKGMQLIFPLESSVELPATATQETPYFKNRNSGTVCEEEVLNQNQNNSDSRNFDDDID